MHDACTEKLRFVELELPIACYKWMRLKLQDEGKNVWGVLNLIYLAVALKSRFSRFTMKDSEIRLLINLANQSTEHKPDRGVSPRGHHRAAGWAGHECAAGGHWQQH